MRLILKLLVFIAFQVTVAAYAQTKVTLKLKSAGFEQLITEIQKQTAYHFIYSADKIPEYPVSIKTRQQDLLLVLDKVLAKSAYTYKVLDNKLIAIVPLTSLMNIQLNGRVYNTQKQPLAGTSVQIKGTQTGTRTDQTGSFSISAAANSILVFSQVGYHKKEFSFNRDSSPEIILSAVSNELDEVVVTALDIKKEERKIGYSIATITGNSLTKARESNMAYALEGRVAGLNVSGVNGGPASSARILLRGVASMSAGSPLFVVNGVPIDNTQRGSATEYGGVEYGDGISNINPDDIETLTILKGSAASALYGARAANGVILITIKTGKKNNGLTIEYNTNLSYDNPVNNTDFQYVYGQGIQNQRPQNISAAIQSGLSSWGEQLDGKPFVQSDGKTYPYRAFKNNIKDFYRVASVSTNTVSANYGGEKIIVHLSASNLDQESIIKNSNLNRKTFNVYTSYELNKKLNISFNGNYIHEFNRNRSYLSDGPLNANYGIAGLATTVNQAILAPGYHPETGAESPWNSDEYKTNPYFMLNKQADQSGRERFISSLSAKYAFNDWIYLQGRVGYDHSNDRLLRIIPTGTAFSVNGQGGINAKEESEISEFNTDFLLAASKDLSDQLNLSVSAGTNYRKRNYNVNSLKGSIFKVPYLYTAGNLASAASTYTVAELVTQSAYYTADLSYKKLLTFSATGRYDVYSSLPQNNRGIFVPGVSASFVFSDLLGLKQLDYGKIRASFAKTSGEPAQPYTTQTYYFIDNTINGIPAGNFSRNLPNHNLKPFTLSEFETGASLKFFNSRLYLDFTYFHRLTTNEIINAEQSVTSGFTSAYVNLGKTRNTGVELTVEGLPVSHPDFKWNSSVNISHVNNLLLSIDGSSKFLLTGTYRPLNANTALVVGEPITQVMAYDYKRDGKGNIIIGPDGVPLRGELKAMGSTMPKLYGGFSNTFSFKNFNFSFLVDFKYGSKILSATENYSYVQGLNKETLNGRENGVVAQGVLADGSVNTINVPAYTYYPQLATNVSALSVLNGSFIKLRQITIGYDFSAQSLRKTPFSAISVDLVARNVLTFLKYTKNIDPESEFSSSLAYAGIEGGSLPSIRTYGVNMNFKFKQAKKR